MITNIERAKWADKAIQAFRKQTGCDFEDSLGDLLCDLMHWAIAENRDFDAALDTARTHYEAECEETAEDSKNGAKTLTIAESAIYANLSVLAEQLADAAKLLAEAAAASKLGKQNLAIGTALSLEDLLSQSKALYDAAIALHRRASRE